MMRTGLLWLSEQPQVFRFVRSNPLARRFASRFVAGETVETAVEAVRELNRRKITATLDLLGESLAREPEPPQARDTYLQMRPEPGERTLTAAVMACRTGRLRG